MYGKTVKEAVLATETRAKKAGGFAACLELIDKTRRIKNAERGKIHACTGIKD